MVQRLLTRNPDAQTDRVYAAISESAEVRYHAFIDSLSDFHQRVPCTWWLPTRVPRGAHQRRGAQLADIAAVVAFLAGPDTGFVNGAILLVDGGVFASNGQPSFLALMGQG